MGQEHKYCYEYPRAAITTDCLLFSKTEFATHILLIERKNDPYKESWGLPGGFLDMTENAEECALRELEEETGVTNISLVQLHTFSDIDRDPRGRTISIVYFGIVEKDNCKIRAGDDASKVQWFPIDNLPELAFDHREIIELGIKKLQNRTN